MYDGFFADFGLPRQLHSDLGKNFESKLFCELCLLAGVSKSHTTAFHPQSDGQTERMNRTLIQMLKTTADDNPATWPQRLSTVMAAYRMTVHKTTGMTPNMAVLGREVMMPAALIARPPEEPQRTTVRVCAICETLLDTPTSGYEMPPDRRLGHRSCIMMSVRSKPRSPRVNLFGCFGHGHWSGRSFVNYSVFELVLGASNLLSRHWWWC